MRERGGAGRRLAVTRQLSASLLLILVLSLLGLSLGGGRSAASRQTTTAASGQNGLAAALNPDGSLRADASGSFDARGFRMEYSATGTPRFVAASPLVCNGWDTQFSLNNGVSNASNSGADAVHALAVSGTDIYVGGIFKAAGNVAANRVAKFDTLTNTWSVLGTGGGNGVGGDGFSTISALALSGSDLYVGGNFTMANVGGTTVGANKLAKVNLTTGIWSALGSGGGNGISSGAFNYVSSLALSGSDLYVGGFFTTVNVGGPTVSAHSLAKVNTLTGVWSALGTNGGNGVDNAVFALAVIGSELYVGGSFTGVNVGGPTVFTNNLAKVNTTTGIWSMLGASGGNGVSAGFYSAAVFVLKVSGSELCAGGYFTEATANNVTINANSIAKFNTLSVSWSALGTNSGNGLNGDVRVMVVNGTDIYVGGLFSRAGNVSLKISVARFNTLTNTWSALAITGGSNSIYTGVNALALNGSDLYVGGSFVEFNDVGSVSRTYSLAKVNITTGVWSAVGTSSGILYGGYETIGFDGFINALAVSGNDLYVGGNIFTAYAGGTMVSVNRVAKFNTITGIVSVLGTNGGNGVDNSVKTLALSGGDLIVGGNFMTANVGGTAVGVSNIAKVNPVTGVWSALGNGVNGQVNALTVIGSDLYVGGNFTTANVGGTTVSANSVAKINTTTSIWSALGTFGGNGVNGQVNALAVSGSDLYVGGQFTPVNVGGATVGAGNVAKINMTTGVWSALADTGGGNGVSNVVNALAVSGSNLFVGGGFAAVGDNKASQYIGRFCDNSIPTITAQAGVARQQGSAVSNSQIATVSDADQAANTLAVTVSSDGVTFGASATKNGMTVSNLTVDAIGVVKADVVATCMATAASFTLKVTDSAGAMATATLDVTVNANIPPTLTYTNPAAIGFGSGTTVNPATGPSDNGTVNTIAVQSQGTFTGTVMVNALSFVTISNAAPTGTHTITIRATDNCGATTDASFTLTVNRLTGSLNDPLRCTGPGNVLTDTTTITNTGNATQIVAFTAAPAVPGQLFIIQGSCIVMGQLSGTCLTTPTQATFNGQLAAGQTLTLTYQVQVADNVAPGTSVCINFGASFNSGPVQSGTACVTVNCPAVGPGSIFPATSEMSDQKAGSVLVYNLYSSSIATPNTQNTRVSITNTHPRLPIAVHLFFVDGATCSIADSLVCLTPNQTASFLASDIDPGTTGYIVAVASDRVTGCPVNFNYLIGDEYVKLTSGHAANLAAEAISALAGGLPACDPFSVTAQLSFDGLSYNRVPRVLAASNIPSRADGNDTLLVLNRFGGNLAVGAATLTGVFGILYDDAENPISFTFNPGLCQFRSNLSNNFPRTAPRFEQFIPAGRSGWLKIYSLNDQGLFGAQLNANPNAGTSAGAFNQGHNLHKLTLTPAVVLTIPIFPPNC